MVSVSRTFVVLAGFGWVLGAVHADDKVDYNRDVRPILTNACFKCHGSSTRKAGVRLDLAEEAAKPAKSGATPIVAGKPEKSEIIHRIFARTDDEVMPPPSARKPLQAAQKEILKRWVLQGAPYQKHWSFEPAVKPTVPRVEGLQPNTPIDAFIVARLQRQGLTMSREADRATLIRRVAFTVTGLPPTLVEVDTYLQDNSPDAYEKMVERYLASPRYGEEMARHWLDLARYADTHGLHLDNERQIWPYRDWVVRAFNSNMPFDRFTIEQLAGDLLPSPTRDQLTATGFNRCNVTTGEGGSIDAEWYFRNAVDRTNTMTETWLGLTGGCAVCHDHKFDPLSTREYYGLYAFFNAASGPPLDGNALLTDPVLKLPTPGQEQKLGDLARQIADLKQEMVDKIATLKYLDPADRQPPDANSLKAAGDPTRSFRAWLVGDKNAKGLPPDVKAIFKATTRDGAGEQKLRTYYLQSVCADTKPGFDALTKQINELTKERDKVDKAIVGTFVFKELVPPRESFVMVRGQYDKPGESVEPGTPRVLPSLAKANPKDRATRLDLARWLVAPGHPLTARVAVNRYWQQLFGIGLVKSSSDFGAQGELPSHPEVLDFLAVSFQENGWDVKALIRSMLYSATFRQSSQMTPGSIKADPENQLYARGPRFRLDAEQIRDNALFVSGLMNLEMGGRGVKPYQPPRIWEPVAFTGSNTQNYKQDTGSALYRRSLYTFIKRTAPAPYMSNFDAPNREATCARRDRGNTPLQVLQLMNDVQHFEAARKLAERMLVEGGTMPSDRIRFAFGLLLSRQPEANELAILARALQHYLDRYQKDADAARQAIRVGESVPRPGLAEPELAAYTLIANLLLNLDETVTRN